MSVKSKIKINKSESKILNFSSFVLEKYTYEDFTKSDMEFVEDLYRDGMTDLYDISIECDGILSNRSEGEDCINTVKQILSVIKSRDSKSINSKSCDCLECDCDNCDGNNCDCGCC